MAQFVDRRMSGRWKIDLPQLRLIGTA